MIPVRMPPVIRALGLALAASTHVALSAHAQPADTIPGVRTVQLDGRAVRVQILGLERRRPGEPIVVFEAGASNALEVWRGIPAEVSAFAPAIAYDRAGLGRSAWDSITPTPAHVAARLQRLLRQLGADPPYVLVGYSWGGTLARYFAGYHPSDVAGLVFVDPGPIATQTRAEELAPFEAIGAGRAGYDAYWASFQTIFARMPPAIRAEFVVYRELMALDVSSRGLPPLPDVPVAVIVAAKYQPLPFLQVPYDKHAHHEADVRHRMKMLQEWALASPHGLLVMSNRTTHAIPREEPELVLWCIRRVLDAVRAASPGG